MALTRAEFRAYDFNRIIVSFTMIHDQTEVSCAISTSAMDDLEGYQNSAKRIE